MSRRLEARVKTRLIPMAVVVASLSVAAAGLFLVGCGGSTTTTQSTADTSTTATASMAGPGGAAPIKIDVPLSGADVVPAVQTTASGTFTLTVEALPSGSFNIAYELDIKDTVDATAANIYLGSQGQDGPVVVSLFSGPAKTGSFTGVLAQGAITEQDLTGPLAGQTFAQLAGSVLAGQTYVAVLTKQHPDGELRGQIVVSAAGGGTATTTAGEGATITSAAAGY
jgi:CHRD domain